MNVLVLGGTVFYGRHVVAALLARGHTVTTFNRGRHAVDGDLPVRRLRGDRTDPDDLVRIPPDDWDAVVDPSSDAPAHVAAAARHLRGAGRYVYVSSVSVYALDRAAIDESAPLIADGDGDPDDATAEAYGRRKAASEACVRAAFGPRATILRPGLIVGPYDPTDRFTYWPARFARGGRVLVPGPPERPIQCIDARDLAAFTVHAIETGAGGTYNVTSPRGAWTMRDVADACRAGLDGLPAAVWVDGDFLAAHGCEGWIDLPLWLPPGSAYRGIMDVDVERALHAGLRLRPLTETARDTRAWLAAEPRPALLAGLPPERETELLDAWNAATSS